MSLRAIGRRVALALVLALLAAFPAPTEEALSVSTLVRDPDRYDGEVVRVVGTVTAYRERVSPVAGPYTIFHLREGRASVPVFAWPHQGLRDGLRVRVTGVYVRVKTYGFIKAQRTQAER